MTISAATADLHADDPLPEPGHDCAQRERRRLVLVQVPDVKSVPVVKSAPTYFTTTVEVWLASVPDPTTRSLVTSLLGGGGVPGLTTGWTWRFVGSATAGTDVLDAPVMVVAVVDVLPLVVDVWLVLDPEFESVVDGELFGDDEGLLPQPARTVQGAAGQR